MKKSLVKLMSVILLLGLVLQGCTSNKGNGDDKDKTATYEGKALEDGVLNVGLSADFPPYEYYDKNEIVGIDVEISKAVAEYLGYEIKISDMDFSNIIASIESGKIDAGVSGMTVTKERLESVNFSNSYAKSVQLVVINEDSDIKTIDDLEGKKIGTQLGSTGDIFSKDDFGEENVSSFNKFADAILALNSGNIDAVMMDEQTALSFLEANDSLKALDTAYADEDYAIALPKDNEELLTEINMALKALDEDRTLQEIIDKYID